MIDKEQQEANTNEVVGILLASACLAFACGPLLKGIGERIAKGGGKDDKKGGATFWDWLIHRRESKKESDASSDSSKEKGSDSSSDSSKEKQSQNNEAFNSLLLLSRKANQKEKDANAKKKNDALIKLLTACSFDKDGNEIPLEERIDKMKDTMSPEQFEAFKKDMTETYEKSKDDDKFKDAIKKAKENIKPEQYDELLESAKKEAKETLEALAKEKEEIDAYEKQLNDLDEQINGGDEKDKEIKKLKAELEELKNNPPQTLASSATGVSSSTTSTEEPSSDQKKDPKEELDKIKKEYEEKSAALADEYQKKIDDEKDPDKKKELEDEWAKEEKKLSAEKNKKMDDIDDIDDHTEEDDTKQGKYKVQDEEITDPKTGKKKKVKTYTGPRGGKFYYPAGAPKKPENKVYIENLSLAEYLMMCLG